MKKDLMITRQLKRKTKYFCIKCNRSYESKKAFTTDQKHHESSEQQTRFYL